MSLPPEGIRLESKKHTVCWRASTVSSESEFPAAKPKLQLIMTQISKPKYPYTVASTVKSKPRWSSSRPSRDGHDYSLSASNTSREEELSKKEGERGGASTFSTTCGDTADNAKASAIRATCGQPALAGTTSQSAAARMETLESEADPRSSSRHASSPNALWHVVAEAQTSLTKQSRARDTEDPDREVRTRLQFNKELISTQLEALTQPSRRPVAII